MATTKQYTPTSISPREAKALRDVSFVYNANQVASAIDKAAAGKPETLEKILDYTKQLNVEETKRAAVIELIIKKMDQQHDKLVLNKKSTQQLYPVYEKIEKILGEIETKTKKTANHQAIYNKLLKGTKSVLGDMVKYNHEIYKISHQMQLESNVTWKQYTQLYDQAYSTARRMNAEAGKAVHNSKELIAAQNKLMLDGWKGMDTATLNTLSSQVMLMQKTLGAFPAELSTAFQVSYRIMGENNNKFVTSIGNRLNAFQDTFGYNLATFSNLISTMIASNSVISKDNLKSQVRASESLIKAASLTAQIGILTTNFISDLALTSQYGTMEQMSEIFQGGAYLQGFDTQAFQQKMIGQDYYGATDDLMSSIYKTLNSMDSHYLRAEYMKQISSSFGLSQQDLLNIMNSGGKLDEYRDTVEAQLLNVNTSMEDEIKGLRVDIKDQLENLFNNSSFSQGLGSVMSELGIYGVAGKLDTIIGLMVGNTLLGGKTKGLINAKTAMSVGANGAVTGGGMTLGARAARLGLGSTALMLGNQIGGSMLENSNSAGSTIGGYATNLVSGGLGGALAGSAFGPAGTIIGGLLGTAYGLFNSITSDKASNAAEKAAATKADEDARRANRAATATRSNTGNPALDVLIDEVRGLRSDISNQHNETLKFTAYTNMYNKTTTEKN